MSSPIIDEIRLFGGNFAPRDWHYCDGSLLSISVYQALFALIGTTYGGDGINTFGVPDMRGRVPISQGNGSGLTPRTIGQMSGTETVTLTSSQIPVHSHNAQASTNQGNTTAPGPTVVPAKPVDSLAAPSLYVVPGTSTVNPTLMAPNLLSSVGSGQSHTNMMPTQALNFIICTFGIFPQRN